MFRTDSFTPDGHSLPTDFTVNCFMDTFHSLGLSSSVGDESVGEP